VFNLQYFEEFTFPLVLNHQHIKLLEKLIAAQQLEKSAAFM
jgi:hypothetical protein